MPTSTALPDRWRCTCYGCLGASCSTTAMGTALTGSSCPTHGRSQMLRMTTSLRGVGVWQVLAATYRGLCDACSKTNEFAVLTGCPLLLQLWAYERFAVGRPIVDHNPYELDLYSEFEDDRPTMGTLWYGHQVWM